MNTKKKELDDYESDTNEDTPILSSSKSTAKQYKSTTTLLSEDDKPARKYRQNYQVYENQLVTFAVNDRRATITQNISIVVLLAVNALERFAFYGLLCNFVLYLNESPLFWQSYNASYLLLLLLGICNASGVIGGWIADSFLGKFTTIFISYFIYLIGFAVFPLVAYKSPDIPILCNSNISFSNWTNLNVTKLIDDYNRMNNDGRSLAEENCSWVFILSVILVGTGVGFIKANLGAFGADQVLARGEKMVFKYFNWLYWCINLGSFLSFFGLAYVQQNISFFIGYLIPLAALLISFLLFSCGYFCYIKREANTSVISNIFRVFIEAYKSSKRHKNLLEQKTRAQQLLIDDDIEESMEASETSSAVDGYLDPSLSIYDSVSWLDYAKIRYGGKYDENLVDDVKSLKKILILFTLLIPYWLVYYQVETTFIVQGLHMKLFSEWPQTSSKFMLPIAWLSIADQITVLIMIPIVNSLIYPNLSKKSSDTLSESARLILGMSLSALAVITAGLIESERVYIITTFPQTAVYQMIGNTTYIAADFTILWQIPQYVLIGLSEVFCSVTCVYYAYSAAPKSMQSIIMGLFYFISGFSSFIGSFILWIFKSYIYSDKFSDDINCKSCHLNNFFYIIAGIQIVGMILFIYLDQRFAICRQKSHITINYEGQRAFSPTNNIPELYDNDKDSTRVQGDENATPTIPSINNINENDNLDNITSVNT